MSIYKINIHRFPSPNLEYPLENKINILQIRKQNYSTSTKCVLCAAVTCKNMPKFLKWLGAERG